MASFPLYYCLVYERRQLSAQASLPRVPGASHQKGQVPETCICTYHFKIKIFQYLKQSTKIFYNHKNVSYGYTLHIYCKLLTNTDRANVKICVVIVLNFEVKDVIPKLLCLKTEQQPFLEIFTLHLPKMSVL